MKTKAFLCPTSGSETQPPTPSVHNSALSARPAFPVPVRFPPLPSNPPACSHSLVNSSGFWELTFHGRFAVVPQHQALFHLSWLLSHPHAPAIPALTLATEVFNQFGQHPDFQLNRSTIPPHSSSAVLAILQNKQERLEAALASSSQFSPEESELMTELGVLYYLESACLADLDSSSRFTSDQLVQNFRQLYNSLATAVDYRRNPHPVLRRFAQHLLLYLLIPSNRVSRPGASAHFIYQPPAGHTWLTTT